MNPNTPNLMMSPYLKTNKLAAAGDEEDEAEDEEEEEEKEGENSVRMKFVVSSKLKKKKMSLGEGSGRSSGGGTAAPPCCLVESCRKNLSGCKNYYLRHRVCEVHAKAPVVFVDASRQRFCQQCSKFHELTEFDEMKRSCRRRLAGHNERRRKSSLEPKSTRGNSLHTP